VGRGKREEEERRRLWEMSAIERDLRARGATCVAGVDEVGRGALAGPVAAAAVVLPPDFSLLGINDSKKLSARRRAELYDLILENALACGWGFVGNETIDAINILQATKLAMRRAIEEAGRFLAEGRGDPASEGAKIGHVLIDALTLPDLGLPQTGNVKGDEKSVSIAAASILAKVRRDRLMLEFHRQYPAYAFDKNKGYGTRLHYAGIEAAGLCPLHRRTFCKP
jgi:ribonuclease HII